MRNLLRHGGFDLDRIGGTVPEAMMHELANGYEEVDGIVVPKGWADSFRKSATDETGIECLASKMHVDAFLPEQVPPIVMVRTALAYAYALKAELKASPLEGLFRVIIGASLKDDDSVRDTCVVRFHRLRQGQKWLEDDLEGYRQPIMTLDFSLPS
jgi:hypothetical protein